MEFNPATMNPASIILPTSNNNNIINIIDIIITIIFIIFVVLIYYRYKIKQAK